MVQPLVRLVREEKHDGTLKAAILTLGHLGPEAASAVPSLTTILERRDQRLRAEAARALGAMGQQPRSLCRHFWPPTSAARRPL